MQGTKKLKMFTTHYQRLYHHITQNTRTWIWEILTHRLAEKQGALIGDYGIGIKNERGAHISKFAEEKQLAVLNTFFKLPIGCLYTWKSSRDSPENTVRNQIDYILINKRFRNSSTVAKTYPSADINSDHILLVTNFKLKMKKIKRKHQRKLGSKKNNATVRNWDQRKIKGWMEK